MNVTKTKCPIAMSKFSNFEIFVNFEPLIEHDPHWIKFIILTFISKKKDIINAYWNKIISFDMKKRKFKTNHRI
jgi:hypothetical protein